MEIITNDHHHVRNTRWRRSKKRKTQDVKVVYISSPVKVMTSASRFRALVQELTGQDSDISRFVESNGAYSYDSQTFLHPRGSGAGSAGAEPEPEPHRESPTSSESLLEPFDDVLIGSRVEESFLGMFPSSFCSFENFELDVLGDYDAM